jgi:citrate synthase
MPKQRTLSATQAANELGVSVPTLYAYVSRGLIRSEAAGDDPRSRRYLAEDIEQLQTRKKARRNPARAVQESLHWGAPVLDSKLTLISDGFLRYRGHDAIALAGKTPLEQVAGLLWLDDLKAAGSLFADRVSLPPEWQRMTKQVAGLSMVQKMQVLLPIAGAADAAAYDLRPESVARAGARIARLLVAAATNNEAAGESIGATLQHAWMPAHPPATALLNAALVLCADHELNVSAFTVRCVASSGATPYQVVIAGLSALQGMRHGGNTERVEALWQALGVRASEKGVAAVLTGYLKRGESIPGVGHVLYPQGDPRAIALMRLAGSAFPKAPAIRQYNALSKAAESLVGQLPNIDLALVALAQLLHLPAGGALTLFAIGRTIGWIGHAIEQYQSGQMIRPRARYVGEMPAHSPKT